MPETQPRQQASDLLVAANNMSARSFLRAVYHSTTITLEKVYVAD